MYRQLCLLAVPLVLYVLLTIPLYAQQRQWRGKIDERDGVTVIRNPAEGLWEGNKENLVSIEHIFSIGDLSSTEEYLFN